MNLNRYFNEQFIRTVKGQNNFWNGMLFYLISGGFLDLIQIDFKLEKLIMIKKTAEKDRKGIFFRKVEKWVCTYTESW